MAIVHLLLVACLVAPAPDMPDPMGPEWTAPPPPRAPTPRPVATTSGTSATSPVATSTRPFDSTTQPVVIHHDPPVRSLGHRDRRLFWAAGALAIATVPLTVVTVIGSVKMRQLEAEFVTRRMEDPTGPFPYDIAREYQRQRSITIGTAVGGSLLAVAALVMSFVATRRYRERRGTRRVVTMRGLPSSVGAS